MSVFVFIGSFDIPADRTKERFQSPQDVWSTTGECSDAQQPRRTHSCYSKGRKIKELFAFHKNPSQSYEASPAIWEYTMLPASNAGRLVKNCNSFNPSQTGLYLIYLP